MYLCYIHFGRRSSRLSQHWGHRHATASGWRVLAADLVFVLALIKNWIHFPSRYATQQTRRTFHRGVTVVVTVPSPHCCWWCCSLVFSDSGLQEQRILLFNFLCKSDRCSGSRPVCSLACPVCVFNFNGFSFFLELCFKSWSQKTILFKRRASGGGGDGWRCNEWQAAMIRSFVIYTVCKNVAWIREK